MDCGEFMRLFEPLQKNLYFLILSIVKDADDADDVFQDTALKGCLSFKKLRDPSAFNAWISRIATHAAYDCVRRRRSHVDIETLAIPYYDAYSDPDEELRRAMMTLEEHERTVVVLRAIQGLRYKEIASILRRPEPTVRTVYARAIKKLAAILHDPPDTKKGGADK